jgi:hypothetical protein
MSKAIDATDEKELSKKAYCGGFAEMPNRKHVWRKTIDLNGEEFVVYAVQTPI